MVGLPAVAGFVPNGYHPFAPAKSIARHGRARPAALGLGHGHAKPHVWVDRADGDKPDAGSVVLYPSTLLHRVAPVTRGERYVAVGWVQGQIRDTARRELLFDLETARRRLFDLHGKTAEFDLRSKTSAKLLRMWAEP
jgi:2OG-Fe(II) oxygenase superfamily